MFTCFRKDCTIRRIGFPAIVFVLRPFMFLRSPLEKGRNVQSEVVPNSVKNLQGWLNCAALYSKFMGDQHLLLRWQRASGQRYISVSRRLPSSATSGRSFRSALEPPPMRSLSSYKLMILVLLIHAMLPGDPTQLQISSSSICMMT